MKLVVGLGNPGKEYEQTRHNAGFFVIDKVLKELNLKLDRNKFNAIYTIYKHNGENIIIMKPLTYMNLSGHSVVEFVNFYNIPLEDVIIVHDDLDIPLGKIRIRRNGSSAGQKGMKDIFEMLASQDIKRIRVGISNDKSIEGKDYVLGKIQGDDFITYDQATSKAAQAIIYFFDNDFEAVMNKFN